MVSPSTDSDVLPRREIRRLRTYGSILEHEERSPVCDAARLVGASRQIQNTIQTDERVPVETERQRVLEHPFPSDESLD
jgi:hypothetical protein